METIKEIEYIIDKEIIEKYSVDVLNIIDSKYVGYFKNFLKFAVLRYDFIKNDVKIQKFLREIK